MISPCHKETPSPVNVTGAAEARLAKVAKVVVGFTTVVETGSDVVEVDVMTISSSTNIGKVESSYG